MYHTIDIHQLEIRRGERTVLEIDHLAVHEQETLALIGPNGSGKSTLLLAMSHLIKPFKGSILFKGTDIWEINALNYRRKIGLVLQDPLLLSGTVYDNVATGLRFRGAPKEVIHQRVTTWTEKLGIAHLLNRPAQALSGGEAQRVSLARSFVLEPDIMMLDEPFSALDAPTRRRLLEDIHSLLTTTPVTTIFVTHDMNEALLLGDRVAVLMGGKLMQTDTPHQVFTQPSSQEVAAFVGVETIIPGRVKCVKNGLVEISANGFVLEGVGDAKPNDNVFLCLRPEDITLWCDNQDHPSSARNRLQGRIERLLPEGPLVRVLLDCGFPVTALITRASADELNLSTGILVTASFKATAAHLIIR